MNTLKYSAVVNEKAGLHLNLEPERKNRKVSVYIVSEDEEDLSPGELAILH